jgi:hypothetical protein
MRIQTHTRLVHHRLAALPNEMAAPTRPDALAPVISCMIEELAYSPSFRVDITPDADGLLVGGTQRVLQLDEQADGMVAMQTQRGQLWVTYADYRRLMR